jgi:hypothetical protein
MLEKALRGNYGEYCGRLRVMGKIKAGRARAQWRKNG